MKHLILIGLPGSGKTTAGQALARQLRLPFSDCDAEVTRTAQLSIPDIFRREGEAGFRRRETDELRRLTALDTRVIACGGGVVTVPANRPLLTDSLVLFWDRTPEDIMSTCDLSDRPLLSTATLPQLYALRLPLYREWADAAIDARDLPAAVQTAAALWREKSCDF